MALKLYSSDFQARRRDQSSNSGARRSTPETLGEVSRSIAPTSRRFIFNVSAAA